jgi:hypothetical protein
MPERRSGRATIAAVLAVVAALAGAGSAPAVPSYSSRVTIGADRDRQVFRGRVISSSAHCYVGRTVRVFRARPGRDLYLTRTFTDEAGRWRAIIPAQRAKRLYARVREETVPPGGVRRARCSGDRSRTIVG